MPPEYVLTLGYAADNDVWPVTLLEGALSFALIRPDYGPTSLAQFRAGAEDLPDLKALQE